MEVNFLVPVRPVPKGRPRFYQGRVITDAKTSDYESLVAAYAIEARPAGWPWKKAHSSARFALTLTICYPTAVVADGDNVNKAISDALNGILWSDDRQVRSCMWTITETVPSKCPDGCVFVSVRTIEAPMIFDDQLTLTGDDDGE